MNLDASSSPISRAFQFEGHEVRLVVRDGAPWWVAADVCAVLGLAHVGSALRALDCDEKGVHSTHTLGGPQEMQVINESGLYALVLKSRKPEAKQFRKWVTSEVLPSLRKTGSYSPALPQTLPEALRAYASALEEKAAAEALNERNRPKVEFFERVAASDDTMSMAEAAKLLGLGRNRMMEDMRVDGILNAENVPYQRYVDQGYFRLILRNHQGGGQEHVQPVTRVYPRGVEFLRRRYAPQGVLALAPI